MKFVERTAWILVWIQDFLRRHVRLGRGGDSPECHLYHYDYYFDTSV